MVLVIANRAAPIRRRAPAAACRALAGPQRSCGCLPLGPGRGRLTLVDPDLDADSPEGSPGFVEAVVDIGPQRVQGHAALPVELRARHLGAAQPARALHPDALGAALHRGLHPLAHAPAEPYAPGQLF